MHGKLFYSLLRRHAITFLVEWFLYVFNHAEEIAHIIGVVSEGFIYTHDFLLQLPSPHEKWFLQLCRKRRTKRPWLHYRNISVIYIESIPIDLFLVRRQSDVNRGRVTVTKRRECLCYSSHHLVRYRYLSNISFTCHIWHLSLTCQKSTAGT